MDEQTLEIIPIKTSTEEGDGAALPEKGKRHCIIVVPQKANIW
jgi:hypothetical protein